ncbi:MAG: hypothetical protein FJ118_15075 [Deltaproteobacteria bacterium]|nr:hypothetical protein [Deltaproteobacteria bacterium]
MEGRTFELAYAKFIERFRDQIKENFLEDAFHKRELMSQYQVGEKMLEELSDNILSEFTVNIDRRTSVETIADRYVQLGIRCAEDGVSFSEMVRVFILLKRHIWLFFQESNFAGQPFDVRSIVALNNRTALFFDRAVYYFLVGYEQERSEDRSEVEKVYDALVDLLRRDLAIPKEPKDKE